MLRMTHAKSRPKAARADARLGGEACHQNGQNDQLSAGQAAARASRLRQL
jgi:hypothetical protein